MKKIFLITLLFSMSSSAWADCVVQEKTMLRPDAFGGEVEAGAVAVTHHGSVIGLKEILADAIIFFMQPNGTRSDGYVWMYAQINKVGPNTYRAYSYGEDVLITITPDDAETAVTYVGTLSGKFLAMVCH